jgi:acyl carrier protein
MSLRDELLGTIAAWHLPVAITDDTPLIRSGLLDSLALFNLVLWVEEKAGHPLDPTRVDFRNELNTVTSILEFVARQRQQDAATG